MENLDLQLEIKDFLYHCEFALGKSMNTIKSLRIDLSRFNEYIKNHSELKEISQITHFNFREFFQELKVENVGERSLNRKISSLKSFFKYLKNKNQIEKDPTRLIVPPSYDKGIPDILTENEVARIRETIEIKTHQNLRDRLIFELLYSSGITSQELLALGEDVFNLEEREVVVTSSKKSRIVYFSERAREFFKRYVEAKKEGLEEKYKKEILFVNSTGTRLSDRSLRRLIDRYANRAEIGRDISPHTLRHTFAVYMLEKGMTLVQLQKLLGHSSVDTTRIYVDVLDKKRKKEHIKSLQQIKI